MKGDADRPKLSALQAREERVHCAKGDTKDAVSLLRVSRGHVKSK